MIAPIRTIWAPSAGLPGDDGPPAGCGRQGCWGTAYTATLPSPWAAASSPTRGRRPGTGAAPSAHHGAASKAHFWGRLLSYSAAVSMHSPDLYYAPALEGLKDVVPMAARRNHADRQMLASNRSSLPFALLWL
mmetsp:Transcript_4894/g.13636  ORF Transcript_4894/g.13636 Transcript_4894/m.13636 type:complete len:133 (+) Transcript_4894:1301-1699(+)